MDMFKLGFEVVVVNNTAKVPEGLDIDWPAFTQLIAGGDAVIFHPEFTNNSPTGKTFELTFELDPGFPVGMTFSKNTIIIPPNETVSVMLTVSALEGIGAGTYHTEVKVFWVLV